MLNFTKTFFGVAAAISLVACSAGGLATQPSGGGVGATNSQLSSSKNAQSTLYALNVGGSSATVTVYSQGKTKPTRTITLGPVAEATQRFYNMAVSSAGFLYTELPANPADSHSKGILNIYASKGSKHLATVNLGKNYHLLTTDSVGNVYTMCKTALLCEYTSSGKNVRKINMGKFGLPYWRNIQALAVDDSGNLAVLDDHGALVFPPGPVNPTWSIDEDSGMTLNTSAAFDSSGNLYIAGNNNRVLVYPPNANSPSMVISDGIDAPMQLLCDGQGNLYVLSGLSVVEYAAGQSTPERTITDGISYARSMALDNAGNLYVANKGSSSETGSVTVYTAGSGQLSQTLTSGILNPSVVGVSP